MIKLIILDVDGCLSDGKIIYDANGLESKNFNVKDGFGIVTWLKLGHEVAIITGRESQIVANRAKELGIKHLYQGIKDKHKTLLALLEKLKLDPSEVAAIGDDINDYKMLQNVARSFTPNDGIEDVQKLVQTVLQKRGGEGVVREMIDILVKENGEKERFMAYWV